MSHFHGLIDFVGSHPLFAFVAVLLLALSEAVPVIGTVVPGSTLIIAISALATTADVKPWLLLLAAVVGAIAGDGLSFWLGYRFHRQILRGWPLNRLGHGKIASVHPTIETGVAANETRPHASGRHRTHEAGLPSVRSSRTGQASVASSSASTSHCRSSGTNTSLPRTRAVV